MTDTQSLSERLRKYADMPKNMVMTDVAMREAADALDAKDAEIARLRRELADLRVIADGAADDIELLQATIERHYKVRP
jgi:hypothetical protein